MAEADTRSLYTVSDENDPFKRLLIPLLVREGSRRQRSKKRRRNNGKNAATAVKKRGGKVGRTCSQRKPGDLKREHFSWWKLIHKEDVANPLLKNGKVNSIVVIFFLACLVVNVIVCVPM